MTMLNVANYLIKQILVGNRSLANVLFISVHKVMEIDEKMITQIQTALVDFSGEQVKTITQVALTVYVEGENKMNQIMVIDFPSAYNIIL